MKHQCSRRQILHAGLSIGTAAALSGCGGFAWPRSSSAGTNSDTTVLDAAVSYVEQELITPLRLSSGTITRVTEAQVAVRVRVNGREATGRGSVYLSYLWAWRHPSLSHEQQDAFLRQVCDHIAGNLPTLTGGEAAHPTELGLRLHHAVRNEGAAQPASVRLPRLAMILCASPFDAAIHDAVGHALRKSAFALYEDEPALPGADHLFGGRGGDASRAILAAIRPAQRALRGWAVVSPHDEWKKQLKPWAVDRGYRRFKLKLTGTDNDFDVQQTVDVFRAVRQWGVAAPRLVADSNESNPDLESVEDYLTRLQRADAEAFDALSYLEQPTARDLERHAFDWRPVTMRKPVLVDEALTGLEVFDDVLAQGWSGVALKTCKGHSFALVAAAWAHQQGLLMSLQDLTNPGVALIHAATFAAHLPMINDVELNSPQFTPTANEAWLPRLSSLFQPRDGTHRLPAGPIVGLGSTL